MFDARASDTNCIPAAAGERIHKGIGASVLGGCGGTNMKRRNSSQPEETDVMAVVRDIVSASITALRSSRSSESVSAVESAQRTHIL